MEKLFYVLERTYKMTRIPIRIFDKTGELTLFFKGYEAKSDPLVCDKVLRDAIVAKATNNKLPILMFEEQYIYGACRDTMESFIIVGPVRTSAVSQEHVEQYRDKHNISDNDFFIKVRTLDEICAVLASLTFSITGRYLTELDIIKNTDNENDIVELKKNAYMEYELEHHEQHEPRFNFSVEMLFIKHIKEGNPEAVKQSAESRLDSFHELRVGKLAEKSFKQNEYLACTAIILASRAAIEGGLDSLTSYLMSDLYLQQLEKCTDVSGIYKLIQDMTIAFAQRVNEKKEERSKLSYVEQCKNFVCKRLNKQFEIEDAANEIGINKSYLSRLFSEEEGVGIQKYAQKKRIEASANMLKFSDMSILTISNYLCFTSQSHFGKVFKEQMGMTPQKYRDKNRVQDFKS